MDDREFQDGLLPKLVRIHDDRLDANTIAAFVDGALSQREAARVAARIARDPDALLLVIELRDR